MSFSIGNLAIADDRQEMRDDVHYRARAYGPDARQLTFLIVNISPHGLMARCDTPFETGDRLRIVLPVAGPVSGEIRWSLGGRLGCQFDPAIDLATYYELIAVLVKGK
ncbi:PilZ domain-containing protein [Sphingomonas psychrotolerans]|uniref:Pilus assembly protein PilZ n=1 Tax=Sphingomonas psychrotolerans TaxID=1327635 RepID=A0A2K8MKC7_9SPHN|nr:PilZ domain-containing protein [Sphingomonas psychrotolerans]ATY31651.1 pilus assembly protein PilZ [Sphingomonas psychrotolerans]